MVHKLIKELLFLGRDGCLTSKNKLINLIQFMPLIMPLKTKKPVNVMFTGLSAEKEGLL